VNLEDLLPPPIEVDLGRGKIAFHGLDATQVTKLILTYKDQFLMFMGSNGVQFEGLLMTAPEAVLDILAMASDMEDQRDKFRKIPIAKQVECLGVVYRQSVPDEKKFQESLVGLLATLKSIRGAENQTLTGPLPNSAAPLPTGSTTSLEPDTNSKQ
jgi:hypothetical protein